MSNFEKLKTVSREFTKERDWDRFHSPKNLIMAMFKEIGELSEVFQWKKEELSFRNHLDSSEIQNIEDELSDILIYLIRICDVLEIDIISSSFKKIEKNRNKYPIEKSKGSSVKYNKL
jgi:dCTP diphosphatase